MISRIVAALTIGLALLLSAPLHATLQDLVNGRMLGKSVQPASFTFVAGQPARRDGVMLVEFWAVWCGRCRDAIPALNRLQRDYAARGLTVVGMTRDSRAEIADYVKTTSVDFPIAQDVGGALSQRLALHTIPYAVLVNRNGMVVWQGDPASLKAGQVEAALNAPALTSAVLY